MPRVSSLRFETDSDECISSHYRSSHSLLLMGRWWSCDEVLIIGLLYLERGIRVVSLRPQSSTASAVSSLTPISSN